MLKYITLLYILLLALVISSFGCVKKVPEKEPAKHTVKPAGPSDKKEYTDEHITSIITEDTVWEGTVTVDGIIKVAKGAKLTIRPGTVVEFTYHDYDKDGLGDSGLLVEGGISALGTYEDHILFTAVGGKKNSGAWGMILVNFSNEVLFDYCRFEFSTYTLHIHFSTGSVTNCLFTENEDGTRIGRSRFFIYNNVFKGNRVKGVNFTDSMNEIKYNTITKNKHGVFLFEGDKGSTVAHNNIFDNKLYNFKLGDFFAGSVSLSDNYWGDLTYDEAGAKIFDRKIEETLGTVSIDPAVSRHEDAGIIKDLTIEKVFEFPTDGFIDSSAAVDEESETVYFGSYDGNFYAIDAYSGTLKFKFNAGDVIDSSPAIYGDNVYFASWNRNIYCLDKISGALKWKYEMKASEQDDHRQSSPVVKDGVLFIGGYDGTVYAIDAESGDDKWKFVTNGAIRSKGVIDGEEIIFGSTDGILYGISIKSGRGKYMVNLKSPILSTPLHLGDIIIVATKSGILYTIDNETKTIKNKFDTGAVSFYSAPVSYKGDVVFATTDKKIYRLKKYGLIEKAITEINGPAYATPFVYNDFLLAATNLGNMNIIERGAGFRILDYFLADDAIQSTPVEFDGKLYFGARDNKFYAIKIITETKEGF